MQLIYCVIYKYTVYFKDNKLCYEIQQDEKFFVKITNSEICFTTDTCKICTTFKK